MNKWLRHNAPVLLLCLLTLVFAKLQYNKLGGSPGDACMSICSDGRGYYAWLPAVFIYHDVNFNFFEQVEVKDPICGGVVAGCLQDYRTCTNGVMCNKYYPGTSVMMLPFFATAHLATKWFTHSPANGYTSLYFLLIALSGVCYYLLGMLLFLKILQLTGLSIAQQSLTILLITFGTNIMYYAVDKPSYSHIYSFTQIAAFIYCGLLLRQRYTATRLVLLSFLTGLIFITRPVNVSILLLLPFLFYDAPGFRLRTLYQKPARLLCLLPVIVMPVMLFALYKVATGRYFIYSYGSETFDFLHPHFFQFLFSYDNGVLPYTPLLLMPFLLAPLWLRQGRSVIVYGAALTLLVAIYIHSSWWCWWYGYAFGARTMLDFAPLFGLVVGISIKNAARRQSAILLVVYFGCCALTMLLYHQKNHGYLNTFPTTDYWKAVLHPLS